MAQKDLGWGTQEDNHMLTLSGKVPNVQIFTKKMNEFGIQVRPFYPSLSTASYLNIQDRESTPNAVFWHSHGVSLPSGPHLTDSQINRVIEVLHLVDPNLCE